MMHRVYLGEDGGKNIPVRGMSTGRGPEEGLGAGDLEGPSRAGAEKEGAWWGGKAGEMGYGETL